MLNFTLIIVSFFLGYFFCKKKESIKTFFQSLKFLYGLSKEKQIYNDFFESNFGESDYSNIKERGDIENV